jgi:hypothetical protein
MNGFLQLLVFSVTQSELYALFIYFVYLCIINICVYRIYNSVV